MGFTFNSRPELEGKHAFLSPSKYHWINYTPEKMLDKFNTHMTAVLGTRLHAFAKEAILLGVTMEKNNKTLNAYINDSIGFRMKVEQPLYYSRWAFGCADAIDFDGEVLRIFDLKNGVTPASVHQLEVYAALFCLEYNIKPTRIEYDLRIYQNDEIAAYETYGEDIAIIMDRIVEFNTLIELTEEVG